MEKLIRVENIYKKFGTKEVLKGISFEVNRGEIIALLGKNGAGKSTLIHLLTGLIKVNSGVISIGGRDVHDSLTKNRTGIMFQNNINMDKLTVSETLEMMRAHYRNPLPISVLIELAQIQDFLDQRVSDLSGGQQRRINLVSALVGDPDIIFLDEPTNSMDSHSRYKFWQLMAQLKSAGKTVIVTSHYLEELEDITNRILILSQGKLAYDGNLDRLRQRFGRVTIQFTSQLEPAIINQFPGNKLSHLDDQYKFGMDNPNPFMKALMPYLDDISNLEVHQTSLASIYNQFEEEVHCYEK